MDAVDAQGGDGPSEAEATRGLEGDQRIRGASVPSEGCGFGCDEVDFGDACLVWIDHSLPASCSNTLEWTSQCERFNALPAPGGTDKGKKFLLKRIGQLHRAHAELHQFTAQRELDENKV